MTIRSIDDAFWGWDDVQELSPNAKLLYIYSWTNKHSNIAACYHITKRTISFDTGLSVAQIDKALNELDCKVEYFPEGFIWVKNFVRRQSVGEKLLKAVNNILKKLPTHIATDIYTYNESVRDWYEYVDDYAGNDRVSISYPDPMDRSTILNTDTIPIPITTNNDKKKKISFDEFWSVYPRKDNKDKSRLSWNGLTISEQHLAVKSLPSFICCEQWQDKRYIPMASSWINAKRWNDDMMPSEVEIEGKVL